MKRPMDIERAEDIVRHVIKEYERWGRLYDGRDIPQQDLLEALVFLFQNDSQETQDLRQSLRRSQQELGASKAREARLNKINRELRGEDPEDDESSDD